MTAYYIQSGVVGNCILFWRKGNSGYTCDVNDAEEFTEERARRQVEMRPDTDVAWPMEHIRAVMQSHVNVDRADWNVRIKGVVPPPRVRSSCGLSPDDHAERMAEIEAQDDRGSSGSGTVSAQASILPAVNHNARLIALHRETKP